MTHTGSGIEGEVDSSLEILSDLVEHHLSQMAPFAIFVKVINVNLNTIDEFKLN